MRELPLTVPSQSWHGTPGKKGSKVHSHDPQKGVVHEDGKEKVSREY